MLRIDAGKSLCVRTGLAFAVLAASLAVVVLFPAAISDAEQSHGCVRVQNPMEFADALLLHEPNWNANRLRALFGSKQQWVNPIRSIRTHEFKYNIYIKHGEELYDLENDPHEIRNLAGDPAFRARKRELKATLDRWIEETGDPFYSLSTTEL